MRMTNIRATQAAVIGILVFNLALALGLQGKGRPLAEVYQVTINNINGKHPSGLYGQILVKDGLVAQYSYNRGRKDYESIRPGENALLTGPAGQAISASNSFTIDVALKDKDSPDRHISNGRIEWNVKDTTNKYDVPISHKIDGQHGSATVVYAVLSNAVQATVEVTLIDGDDENPANVYGYMDATNTDASSGYKVVLFQKGADNYINVSPGDHIPLSRFIVAVPIGSTLMISADMYDQDTFSPDDPIAQGAAHFPSQSHGSSRETITGEYGKIQVQVTWSQSLKYEKSTNITIN